MCAAYSARDSRPAGISSIVQSAICAPISVPRIQPRPPLEPAAVLLHHGVDVALRGLQRGDQSKRRAPSWPSVQARTRTRCDPASRRFSTRPHPESTRAARESAPGTTTRREASRTTAPASAMIGALGQQLLNEAATCCADRQTDRDLSGSSRRTREQDVGDVGGGDQQHEPERRHDNARAPENRPPRDRQRQGGCRLHDQRRRATRLLLIDATRDHGEIRPNLRERPHRRGAVRSASASSRARSRESSAPAGTRRPSTWARRTPLSPCRRRRTRRARRQRR